MIKTFKGKIILTNDVIDGYVSIDDGKIVYVGNEKPSYSEIIDLGNDYIAPGFIDIHNHSSMKNMPWQDVDEVANYHLSKGTTTMLMTLYRDIPHDKLLNTLYKIKDAMARNKNLYGAHLEGPYLNAKYGTGFTSAVQTRPDRALYMQYFNTGIVRQTTCAPEVNGIEQYIVDAVNSGVVVAIGHSQAGYEEVKKARELGATIETHTFDATGRSMKDTSFEGTLDMSFDEACMLMDDMFYEVICDSEWVHVRKEMLDLLIKVVGIDKIVCITDCFMGGVEDGRDINVVNGELCGSKLSMDRVAVNLFNAGFTMCEIAKLTAFNPSRAIKAYDRGEIAVGKKADLIRLSNNAKFIEVLSLA